MGRPAGTVGERRRDAAPDARPGGPVRNLARRRPARAAGAIDAAGAGRRLLGVDAVWHDGFPFVVEVNPRYTASVEVLEYATGHSALGWQRGVFLSQLPPPPPTAPAAGVIGKAVFFAPRALRFPSDGPWME